LVSLFAIVDPVGLLPVFNILINSFKVTEGLNVVSRIMGLLLIALGVEIMVGRIRNIFPRLL